jgi:hypothetical protein
MWPVAVAGLVTTVAWVLLTLATSQTGESLWRVTRLLPGGTATRVVTRVYVTVYLFGSVGALLWLTMVLERVERSWVKAAVLVPLFAVLAWEQTGFEQESFPRSEFYPRIEQHANTLRGAKAGYVIPQYVDSKGLPLCGPYGQVLAMWIGMRANVPVVNGYSGRSPRDFPAPPPDGILGTLSDDHIRKWLTGKFHGTVRVIDPEAPGVSRPIEVE